MDSIFVILLLCLISAAATFAACHWWYGKRLREMAARMGKLESDRQTAVQMAQQARRQIEQMQRDAATTGKERAAALAARRRVEVMEATLNQAERGDTQIMPDRPGLPSHGFADTLPMEEGPDGRPRPR